MLQFRQTVEPKITDSYLLFVKDIDKITTEPIGEGLVILTKSTSSTQKEYPFPLPTVDIFDKIGISISLTSTFKMDNDLYYAYEIPLSHDMLGAIGIYNDSLSSRIRMSIENDIHHPKLFTLVINTTRSSILNPEPNEFRYESNELIIAYNKHYNSEPRNHIRMLSTECYRMFPHLFRDASQLNIGAKPNSSLLSKVNSNSAIACPKNMVVVGENGINHMRMNSNTSALGGARPFPNNIARVIEAESNIDIRTFKTPIQDQRLESADIEIMNWIGDRELVKIDSVVSDNKLIRTVVVKNK